ncbi:class I SAM-dependent methyltransferase [Methanobacterium aggregans]|uniref:class I SAM-dependent methyltransferase n=1 Tax=Methanobacterium aggregans TaxID=1615586 RepID=UPI001AEB00D8|nr:class I SAM-dependent methyltransferase [Methanobacterium aggregans]MBP2044812.1 ubiquinone/menaquinone biosynthesis C-methylase UbiE [Methanobacterium aggregans]
MSDKHGHKHHGKSSRDVLSAEEVLKNIEIKKGDIFLDAGCGDGYLSIAASKLVGDEGKVHSLDLYEKSIDSLKKEAQDEGITNITAEVTDLTQKLPLDDNAIDVGIMANVMHGFAAEGEVPEVMNEIKRVIKPGGTFSLVEFRKIQSQRGPPYEIRLGPADVAEILSPYGFQIKEALEIGEYHYIVVAVKK